MNTTKNKFGINSFLGLYPNENICLEKLFKLRYGNLNECPECEIINPKFYRVKKRKSFECGSCGYQIYPMAGTIMEGTTLTLHKWFYAIFLFAVSKNGVSAKELERTLEITYKTAWRLGHQIRKLLADDNIKLKGLVEIDESLYGGKSHGKRGWGAEGRVVLFGMIERNGKVRVKVVPNRQRDTIIPVIKESVKQRSLVHTDKYKGYHDLPKHTYKHRRKDGRAIHINSMEGYWGNFKKAMLGTHTWVSSKHLQNYLDEFQFRHNNRRKTPIMFDLMLERIVK